MWCPINTGYKNCLLNDKLEAHSDVMILQEDD